MIKHVKRILITGPAYIGRKSGRFKLGVQCKWGGRKVPTAPAARKPLKAYIFAETRT